MKLGVTVGEASEETLQIALFGRVVPRTVENFVGLCTGSHGVSKLGTRSHYVGTRFQRVMRGFSEAYVTRTHTPEP